MARRRKYPQSRGAAEDLGSSAIRAILSKEKLLLEDLAKIAGVHATAAGRWLYGIRPSRQSAKRLEENYPQHVTAKVIAYWGYKQC